MDSRMGGGSMIIYKKVLNPTEYKIVSITLYNCDI